MKEEVRSAIVISICVILILVIVYFSTAIFMTGEIGGKKNDDKKIDISEYTSEDKFTNRVLLSKLLLQKEETYKVVIFSKNNASDELKNSILNYNGEIKLYIINTDEAINKSVKSDHYNLEVSNPNDLKVKDSALLTITNGQIVNSISSSVSVIQELK